MAIKKTNADYKREQRERAKLEAERLRIVERKLPVPAATFQMMTDLCKWHEFSDWRELLFTMIRVCHGAGPGQNFLVEIPKVGFVPTEAQLIKCGEECPGCKQLGFICAICEEFSE